MKRGCSYPWTILIWVHGLVYDSLLLGINIDHSNFGTFPNFCIVVPCVENDPFIIEVENGIVVKGMSSIGLGKRFNFIHGNRILITTGKKTAAITRSKLWILAGKKAKIAVLD